MVHVLACLALAAAWFLAGAPLGIGVEHTIDVDSSYRMVLGLQHTLGLRSGNDIVYTFGPLGFLCFWSVGETEAVLKIVFWVLHDVGLAGGVWAIAYAATGSIARALALSAAVLLLAVLSGNADPLLVLGLPALVALASTLGDVELPAYGRRCLVLAIAIASLTKFTYFFFGAIAIAALSWDALAVRRRAPVALLEAVVAIALLWLVLGQDPSGFAPFVVGSLDLASGYGELGAGAGAREAVLLAATAAIVAAVWCAVAISAWRRLRWTGAFTVLLWTAFLAIGAKIGFTVYSESHFAQQAMAYLFAAGAATALSTLRHERLAAALAATGAVGALVLATFVLPETHPVQRIAGLGHRVRIATRQLAEIPSIDQRARDAMDAAHAAIRAAHPMPAFDGSVDLVSDEQALLLAHGVSYAPRPCFQTIACWTRALVERNAAWLRSDRRPANLLVRPSTPRGALPAVTDGRSWLEMLGGYRYEGRVSEYAWLRRRDRCDAPTLVPIGQRVVNFGEEIEVPSVAPGELVWLEVEARPSLVGHVVRLALRLEPMVLTARTPDGDKASRVPPGVARAGFLLSPVVETSDDFAALFIESGRLELRRKQARAVRFDVASGALYRGELQLRFHVVRFAPPG